MVTWRDAPVLDASALSSLGLPRIVAQALLRRGITTTETARAYLDPAQAPVSPSTDLPGMDGAVQRIMSSIDCHESVCVWGDFDVDGQTATTVLVQAFQALGLNPRYYIPIRGKEGHGVHIESLAPLLSNGVTLIVTCDTGSTAREAMDYASARGVDFVITDHHDLNDGLPEAVAFVNPKMLPRDHRLASLAGVGVAYELAKALLDARGIGSDFLLDLVALGLIADVATLTGETRSLAQRGIQALRHTPRLGLRALADLAGSDLGTLTEETIGFSVAPRLNALGRLSDANQAVEFLLTKDSVRAHLLAAQIEGLNIRRRLLTDQVYGAAEEQLRTDASLLARPILILAHPTWPGGVLGIVASRLVERYRKPALLLSAADDGSLRGSARSIEGLNITEAIAANPKTLRGFGGHPMAAGVSLDSANLPRFQKSLEKTVESMLADAHVPEEVLEIDEWLSLDRLSIELADEVGHLAPFGAGNPQPIFATRALALRSAEEIGKTREHRRLVVTDDDGASLELLWWNSAGEDLPSGRFDLAYSMRATSFGGERRLTVEFKDFRMVEAAAIEVTAAKLELNDYRSRPQLDRLPDPCLIWAESDDRSKGVDRLGLHASDNFAIWTTPPSRQELAAALKVVQPKSLFLFGIAPAAEPVNAFLSRLAGMAKYALGKRAGRLSVSELAAVTAHRELTVRLGLEWLAAGGHLRIYGNDDLLQFEPANGEADTYLQAELYAGVRSLLDETSAYRAYFGRATADLLVQM